MGCDIHSRVRVLRDGQWEFIDAHIFPEDDVLEVPVLAETDVVRKVLQRFGIKGTAEPFNWRSYGMFGFLADVRNYSKIPTISEQRGLPEDLEASNEEYFGDHSYSWLWLSELVSFNYDQTFEDLRYTKQIGPRSFDGAAIAEPGNGKQVTFREFLGPVFFRDIEIMKQLGDPSCIQIVFGFDN